jgi:hypothetical protein
MNRLCLEARRSKRCRSYLSGPDASYPFNNNLGKAVHFTLH